MRRPYTWRGSYWPTFTGIDPVGRLPSALGSPPPLDYARYSLRGRIRSRRAACIMPLSLITTIRIRHDADTFHFTLCWQPGADWWRGAVIYQIYPRSFMDSRGDGIGDLRGVIEKLDYIASLNVDAIWLSPFFTSPMKDFGYDISNYRDVDPMFGSLEDFDRLVEAAHARGLKVTIDQVMSHTSDQHAWFEESRQSRDNPKADWYVWADPKPDGAPPTNWQSVFGGSAWQWDTRRCQYYLHNFLASQPDLNFRTPAVVEAILEEARFWLERGVDGFRLDAVNFCTHGELKDNPPRQEITESFLGVRPDNPYGYQLHQYDKTQPENLVFLERLRALLDEYPGATSVGEVGDDDALGVMAAYSRGAAAAHVLLVQPADRQGRPDVPARNADRDGSADWRWLALLGAGQP